MYHYPNTNCLISQTVPIVALVQVGGYPPELDELVLLECLGQLDVVEVVEGIDTGPDSLVVFLRDQQTVQGLGQERGRIGRGRKEDN